jgi:DNA polymerase III gamma/tau subunit
MSRQIFKNCVPNELLFDLLESICFKNEKYFILTMESFKKGVYKETIQQFFENCKQYYHISKRKYLERKVSYNSFTTILRQICNFNKIIYTSQIKYDKSSYNIVYYIYF